MRRVWCVIVLCLAGFAAPVSAQTRAWLDRAQVTYGETAVLNIETDQDVAQVDYAPLGRQFELAGQSVRRRFARENGRSVRTSVFSVGLRPRGPGVLTVPALQVGTTITAPQRLVVVPPSVQAANADADVFIETTVDAARPYVQQAVGVMVRLHYAVPLMSGQLDQDAPAGASLQRVGEDITYQRELGGRRYNVVERRFLLVPERSGTLDLPGARFNGQTAGGFFDQVFDDGRRALAAAAPAKRMQVLPIPVQAAQPWLPLRDLGLRYLASPSQARAGEATVVELELVADGASASQLPELAMGGAADVQAFADPPQSDEQFVDGRPRTTVRRRIALVPAHAGTLQVPGPTITWWDAGYGVARTTRLAPLVLRVAPGSQAAAGDPDPTAGVPSTRSVGSVPRSVSTAITLALGVLVVVVLVWLARRRTRSPLSDAGERASPPTPSAAEVPPALAEVLRAGDLDAVAQALMRDAALRDLDAVAERLADPGQRAAVRALQAARWGHADVVTARDALRKAFAGGARWQAAPRVQPSLLPPLYPPG